MSLNPVARSIALSFVLVAACGYSVNTVASGDPKILAKKTTRALFQFHRKDKSALLRTSKKPEFKNYFLTSDPIEREALRTKIETATLKVQKHFDVSEMCLINANGKEITRVVAGKIAKDLSEDEASSPFFRDGFATLEGDVMLSPIYLSADTSEWVIAYITPIEVNGQKRAILHYEHKMKSLQDRVLKAVKNKSHKIMAINRAGLTIINSVDPIDYSKQTGMVKASAYFDTFLLEGKSLDEVVAMIDAGEPIGDWRGSYKKIGHWTILALHP